MKHSYIYFLPFSIVILLMLTVKPSYSQCPDPTLYDLNFTKATSAPEWENCIDNASDPNQFILTLISPEDVQNYELDFGDGSPVQTGALWPANTPITHTYDLGVYYITLSETRNGCTTTITGKLTNDRKAGATAIPPTIGTSGCVPHTLTFINQSTNTSPFTVFEWDWGDGTTEIVGPENVGKPMSHVYEKGRAGCDMVVSLTAYSLCDTTFSSYGPYDFWDIDTAVVTASATRICGGQDVTFTDQTLYNCNLKQPRKIRWDFREVGGPLTGWLPATPENKSQTYFISGNVGDQFTVFMEDSNYCGVDPASVTVEIIGPPEAQVNVPNPVICAGQEGVFENESTGGADLYIWDFGDGSAPYSTGSAANASHRYVNPGTYTVKLVAAISGTDLCKDSITTSIEVLPSSVSDFSLDKIEGCAPLTVNITDLSQNADTWAWDFGELGTSANPNPAPLEYTKEGTYEIELATSNSLGCGSVKSSTVTVYPSVTVAAEVDSVCLGSVINFLDKSTLSSESSDCAKGSILYEVWDNISGDEISDLTTSPDFPDAPSGSSLLTSFEAPLNNGSEFGSRIRGYICPPQNGNYVFWIASDDNSELWLSSDANPENKVLIASVDGHTGSREWNKFSSQQSVPVYLSSGQKYYIEALHKEGSGGDNLAVGWQLPSGTRERPIGGNRLSPYSEGSVINSWSWDFGNGDTSDEKDPSYTYPVAGDYNVQLTVSTGKCSTSNTYPVKVYPPAVADFWQSDTAGCTPFDVNFAELATANDLIWNFGDNTPGEVYQKGEKDTVAHTFINNTGVNQSYYISLIAESGAGCRDTTIKKVTVYPGPNADFSFTPSVPQCSPVAVTFNNESGAADSYKWYFGSYDSSNTTSSEFDYEFINKTGIVRHDTIILQAYSSSGCYGEKTQVITVFPEPEFSIIAEPDTACHPANVKFSASGNPATYLWDFGDASASSQSQPEHIYYNTTSNDTVFNVKLFGSSAFGCKDTAFKAIVVNPVPEADFITDVSSGCSPLSVNFENLSTGASANIWTYENGEVDTVNQASHSYTFINSGTEVKNIDVVLKVVNSAGCFDEKTVTITVYPEVLASFTPIDSSGCSPFDLPFTNTSEGASMFTWNFGDGTSSADRDPIHEFVNYSDNDTTYTVRLFASSEFGCKDTSYGEVRVYKLPEADFITDVTSGCSPLNVNFQNISTGASMNIWTFEDGIVDTVNLATQSYTFINTGSDVKTFDVNLEVINEAGCYDEKTVTISVYPEIKAEFTPDISSGCSPLSVTFENKSTGAATYTWNFGNGSSSADENPAHVFTNTESKDTIYNVKLFTSSAFGCKDTASGSVSVFALPVADYVTDLTSGCSPLTVNFENLTSGGALNIWTHEIGQTDTINSAYHSYTFTNSGTDAKTFETGLKVVSSSGCIDEESLEITVYPEISAAFTPEISSGCSPLNVNFINTSTGASVYTWRYGDGKSSADINPSHEFKNGGDDDTSFTVKLFTSSSFGCRDTATGLVTVFALPEANFLTDVTEGCSPLTVQISNFAYNSDSTTWNFGDGSTAWGSSEKFSHEFLNSGMLPVTYSVKQEVYTENGCKDLKTSSITVFPEVSAFFVASDTASCPPFDVKFSNLSSNAEYYIWDFGNASTSAEENPSAEFQNIIDKDTTYTVKLTARSSYNCQAEFSDEITVFPLPKPSIVLAPSTGCSPLNVTVQNNTLGAEEFLWDFGDGEVSSNESNAFEKEYENFGSKEKSFTLKLTATSSKGCKDTVSKPVKVFPAVRAGAASSDTAGCSPFEVSFYNNSLNAGSYIWNFGDGSQAATPSPKHTFINNSNTQDTVFSVSMVASNSYNCKDTIQKEILVFAKPKAEFIPDRSSGCSPLTVEFSNTSVGGSSYLWDYGTDSTDNNPDSQFCFTFENAGQTVENYEVNLEVLSEKGCSATSKRTVTVYPKVTAAFQSDPNGCTPFTVKLNNKTIGGATYSWDFGDGQISTENSPFHTYSNISSADTTFDIKLIAVSSFGCSDTLNDQIKVYSKPKAIFSVSPAFIQLPDSTVEIINSSSPGDWVYSWDFGDGQRSDVKDPVQHHYNFYGTYKIRLAVSGSNCSDTAYQVVTVNPTKPIAKFSGNGEGCSPVIVQFENASKFADRFFWDFGDGNTSDLRNPKHLYDMPGTYTVTLKASGQGGDDIVVLEDVVTVNPIPVAFFTVKPNDKAVKIPGNSHYFANLSENAISFHWDFGDGATSTERSPFHAYTKVGTYDVTLTATNEYGCSNQYTEIGAAIAEAGGKIVVPNAFTPSGGGNLNSAGQNDYFNPLSEGVVEFHMQIFNRWGELIFETFELEPGWDGTYRGKLCKQDVYVFKLKAKFVDGEVVEKVGDVTLIR